VVGASKVARDVTAQRAAEDRERELLGAAAAANAKFQAFFQQGALFAGIMDLDGTLLEANRLSLEGCGYTREDVVGRPFWDGPWWSPSPRLVEQVKAAWAQAAAGEAYRAEMPYFMANGIERLADVSILPIKDDTGRVLFLAPTGVDITERKRAEADREKFARDLSDADRRKNEFLAMLAHELRNPLAPIANAARALRLADGHDPEALRSASQTLDRQVAQMARLVDDLLDMSRITRGKIALRRERIELAPVVHQAVEAVRALYNSMNHELSVRLPPAPIYLEADPARLAQVIANLLNNACKFTDRGGHVVLSVSRDGDEAVIRVSDDGIGIAAEHLPRLFDMFAQVDTSLERSRDGLGIGLTLVQSLVELHGGAVCAHSEGIGRGSEFTVRLPLLVQGDTPVTAPLPPKPAAVGGRRVLVVDDNEDGAESLAMLLQFGGHQTYKARDGVEAIAAAEQLRPDAVLLDIGLPRLNGYEACSRIREQPWGKDLLIIALTGWGQDEDRQRSKEAGFDEHMVKPVDYDTLMELLAVPEAVRRRNAEAASS
jgi:PAS domain S-box-containing protein